MIDFDKLQNGKGLIEYAGTYTEGEFTIDSTYFEPGQQYVIFGFTNSLIHGIPENLR
ncbi:MAG: hypothetical protein IPN15_16930 [Saprospiraceae bacterium]|nr:hypothetical protein [Candidatus Vicinibacter affinis]